MSSYRGVISPDEIRGREIVRKAIEEKLNAERRKRAELKGEVLEGTHKFIYGTDGVHHAGSKIIVTPKDLKKIIKKEKRLLTMESMDMDSEVIEYNRRDLLGDRSYLEFASHRGPERIEIEDHREADLKPSIGSQLRGLFGKRKQKEDTVEIEVVKD